MVREVTLHAGGTGPMSLQAFKARLEDPTPLLKQIGALLVSDSKQAFERQALGSIPWPARYPHQRGPFINIAWALKDFAAGRRAPLPRRFSDRPAGIDTGDTKRATAFRVAPPDAVEIGNPMPWANAMQRGGVEGVIPITGSMKALMGKYLRSKKTRASWIGPEATDDEIAEAAKKKGLRYVPEKKPAKDGSLAFMAQNPYLHKLGPLMKKDAYRITGYARPFIGVTDESRGYMLRAVEDFIATGESGL